MRQVGWLGCLLLLGLSACGSPRSQVATTGDSTAVVLGDLAGNFVHGSPLFGSVVYLIPVGHLSTEWWRGFARPLPPVQDPLHIRVHERTTSDALGRFQFRDVPPGGYYLYARVIWISTIWVGYPTPRESTFIQGYPWLGSVWVPRRDTARVVLRNAWGIGASFDSTWEMNRAMLERNLDSLLHRRDASQLGTDESPSSRLTGWIDLNADGKLEGVVLLRPRTGWKKGATSSLLVFEQNEEGLDLVSRTNGIQGWVNAAPTTTGGWRDLIVSQPGSPEFQYRRLRFQHDRYPGDVANTDSAKSIDAAIPNATRVIDGWWDW